MKEYVRWPLGMGALWALEANSSSHEKAAENLGGKPDSASWCSSGSSLLSFTVSDKQLSHGKGSVQEEGKGRSCSNSDAVLR